MLNKIKSLEFCAEFWTDILVFITNQIKSEMPIGRITKVKEFVFFNNKSRYIEKYGDDFIWRLQSWYYCTMCLECRMRCRECLLSNLWHRTHYYKDLATCDCAGTPYRKICVQLIRYSAGIHYDVKGIHYDVKGTETIKENINTIVNECYIEIANLKGELPK